MNLMELIVEYARCLQNSEALAEQMLRDTLGDGVEADVLAKHIQSCFINTTINLSAMQHLQKAIVILNEQSVEPAKADRPPGMGAWGFQG